MVLDWPLVENMGIVLFDIKYQSKKKNTEFLKSSL